MTFFFLHNSGRSETHIFPGKVGSRTIAQTSTPTAGKTAGTSSLHPASRPSASGNTTTFASFYLHQYSLSLRLSASYNTPSLCALSSPPEPHSPPPTAASKNTHSIAPYNSGLLQPLQLSNYPILEGTDVQYTAAAGTLKKNGGHSHQNKHAHHNTTLLIEEQRTQIEVEEHQQQAKHKLDSKNIIKI
ncbi:unnamed protein product [Vicia faba]|uniref:Uncharacterized protein n=1 Tax=Vicia faba TaxID=3906 RepID=A0AAV0YIV5_VICFA|nr:unnamed protein product [Vicia faba]